MKLESARVRIRERTRWEVLDLAFLFIKLNAKPFALLAVATGVPFGLVMFGLGVWARGGSDGPGSFFRAYAALVLVAVLTRLLRLPFLALAADAMFRSGPSVRDALRRPWRTELGRPVRHALGRLLPTAVVLPLFIECTSEYVADEITMLEAVPADRLRSRVAYFHEPLRSKCWPFLMANGAMGGLVLTVCCLAGAGVRLIALREVQVDLSIGLLTEIPFIVGFVLSQIYCCVARFLFYLNLRTVHEGWDLFLVVRRLRAAWDRPAALA